MFTVVDNKTITLHTLPGIRHRTVGGKAQGVRTMEVWQQTIAPRSATPVHRHDCEEVVVILSGSGTCTIDGETATFGPDSTLIIPPDAVHQITNTSDQDMHLVAAFGMAPVRVRTAEGTSLPLPWDAG